MPADETALLLGARIEFHSIFGRLAEFSEARAEEFDETVHEGMEQLSQFPHSAPLHIGRYRRLVLAGFPYALYYAVDGTRVFVHAILDTRLSRVAIARRLGL